RLDVHAALARRRARSSTYASGSTSSTSISKRRQNADSSGVGAGSTAHERYGRRDVRAAQVVDVIVLGDDEALPLALRERVDGAMELEEDGAPIEGEL